LRRAGVRRARGRARAAACLRRALDRGAEEGEPAREILLDRQLMLELRLQLELLGVVALLVLAGGDERPERASLVAVDPVDRVLAAVEAEHRGEELGPEALGLELGRDSVSARHEILEIRVADHEPLEAEGVRLTVDRRAGVLRRGLEELLDVATDALEV